MLCLQSWFHYKGSKSGIAGGRDAHAGSNVDHCSQHVALVTKPQYIELFPESGSFKAEVWIICPLMELSL